MLFAFPLASCVVSPLFPRYRDGLRARGPECPPAGCANMTEYWAGTSGMEAVTRGVVGGSVITSVVGKVGG